MSVTVGKKGIRRWIGDVGLGVIGVGLGAIGIANTISVGYADGLEMLSA
jgi:hypothetical protein